jgi:hypothetical protein
VLHLFKISARATFDRPRKVLIFNDDTAGYPRECFSVTSR